MLILIFEALFLFIKSVLNKYNKQKKNVDKFVGDKAAVWQQLET